MTTLDKATAIRKFNDLYEKVGNGAGTSDSSVAALITDPSTSTSEAVKNKVDEAVQDIEVVVEHGGLGGLDGDDHPQYLTQDRADGRYYTKGEVDGELDTKQDAGDYATSAELAGKVTGLTGITALWRGTQAQYDSLTPDSDTVYIIVVGEA